MTVSHTVSIACKDATEAQEIQRILNTYNFSAEGLKKIDYYYNRQFDIVGKAVRGLVKKR